MFEPFVYGRLEGQSVELDVDQLHTLLFADDEESPGAMPTQRIKLIKMSAHATSPSFSVRKQKSSMALQLSFSRMRISANRGWPTERSNWPKIHWRTS
jgi:hypothetical protein